MEWTKYQIILAVVMVATGSINTLSTKWADMLNGLGSDSKVRPFDHPFVQSLSMFFGEILCLLAFKAFFIYYTRRPDMSSLDEQPLLRGSQEFSPMLFLPPAMCDMFATSIMYIGLNLTYASSFQMFRGSVIVFVALLSVGFLGREISKKQWSGIGLVVVGLAIVGLSDYLLVQDGGSARRDTNSIITGDLLIIAAQVITAMQMVYEEKYVVSKDVPALQAVGWEGMFGFSVLGLLMVPFYYIRVDPPFSNNAHHVLEDLPDALVQMLDNKLILLAIIGTVVSISFFNFAGISVTKEMSATSRMILDSVRTLFIWLISLAFGWQRFHPLQILGFSLLVFGMCVYNNILPSRMNLGWRASRHDILVNTPADEP